eukprot:2421201-Pleurochrysis_carterae.AAC.1
MEQAPPNSHARGRVGARSHAKLTSMVRLREGDVVSVTVSTFCVQYAISRSAVPWTSASVRDNLEHYAKAKGLLPST